MYVYKSSVCIKKIPNSLYWLTSFSGFYFVLDVNHENFMSVWQCLFIYLVFCAKTTILTTNEREHKKKLIENPH